CGDVVDLLPRITRIGARARIVLGPVQVDDLRARTAWVEIRIALRYGDIGRVQLTAATVGSQIDVVIDELPPSVDPVGHQPAIGDAAVGRVGSDEVADEPSTGPIGAGES